MQSCLDSVADWAERHGYQYLFIGDELFEPLPAWYRQKLAARLPVAADLARLLWLQQLLQRRAADVVAWLDADVLVFAPSVWRVELVQDCVFGYERWLQKEDNKLGYRIHKNVHNAYCAFSRDSTTLPFLIDRIQWLVKEVDIERMPPQFVGPKLLTSLRNIVGLDVDEQAGAVSPMLASALLQPHSDLLAGYLSQLQTPMCAANLCASLVRDTQRGATMQLLVQRLLEFKNGLK